MGVFVCVCCEELDVYVDVLCDVDYYLLCVVEIGMILVCGCMGGIGSLFNFGEMIVICCVVWFGDGCIGYSYVVGCDKCYVELVVLVDVYLQGVDVVVWQVCLIELLVCIQVECCVVQEVEIVIIKVEFFILV